MSPKITKEILLYIFFSVLLFLLSFFYGFTQESPFLNEIMKEAKKMSGFFLQFSPPGLFLMILVHNTLTIFGVVFFSVIFALPALFSLVLNGALIGAVLKVTPSFAYFFWGVFPHGIFELPAFFLGNALGLKIGKETLKAIFSKESTLNDAFNLSKKLFVKIILPLLILAAFIESTITPYLLWKTPF
jgi:stage II sporulation protein M